MESISTYKHILTTNGIFVHVGGGSTGKMVETMVFGPLLSITGNKKFHTLMHQPIKEDSVWMPELIEGGKVKLVI